MTAVSVSQNVPSKLAAFDTASTSILVHPCLTSSTFSLAVWEYFSFVRKVVSSAVNRARSQFFPEEADDHVIISTAAQQAFMVKVKQLHCKGRVFIGGLKKGIHSFKFCNI